MPSPSAPITRDKIILNKNPSALVKTEKEVSIASALNNFFNLKFSLCCQNKSLNNIYLWLNLKINYKKGRKFKMQNEFIINNIAGEKIRQVKILSHQIFKVEQNCNLSTFANSKNLSKADFIFEDPNLLKGHYVIFKPKNYIIHIVRPNQTLEQISSIYNVPVEHILQKNKINTLFIGQQLKI